VSYAERVREGTRSGHEKWISSGQQERMKENTQAKKQIKWQESTWKWFSHVGRYQNHLGNLVKIQKPSPVLLQPAWASVFLTSSPGDSNPLQSVEDQWMKVF